MAIQSASTPPSRHFSSFHLSRSHSVASPPAHTHAPALPLPLPIGIQNKIIYWVILMAIN